MWHINEKNGESLEAMMNYTKISVFALVKQQMYGNSKTALFERTNVNFFCCIYVSMKDNLNSVDKIQNENYYLMIKMYRSSSVGVEITWTHNGRPVTTPPQR
jgi:hypothetical protein